MSLTLIKPGLQTTVQAGARFGMRHMGVPGNGAADPLSMALANRLVSNPWDAAALEITLVGPAVRFDVDCAFAVAGGSVQVTLNGQARDTAETLFARAGDELSIGAVERGTRAYVAFAGGIVADDVLGSQSTNLQAGFGGHEGRALVAGDTLVLAPREVRAEKVPAEFRLAMPAAWAVHACAAAETASLDESSQARLFETNWTIGQRADRMGLRLEGADLDVVSDGRLPSAGVWPGTIQCPEDGVPYMLSVDCGTVGGYPRVAQVARADRHVLGQLRPGEHLRLLRREPDEALEILHAKIGYWQAWLPEIAAILS